MQSRRALLDHYSLHFGNESVEGWIAPGAITAIRLIDRWQRGAGIRGALSEIGVHHGRTLILLALLRREGERALAIDVFEDQHLNVDRSGLGGRARLRENVSRFADEPVVVHQADSLGLTTNRLSKAAQPGCSASTAVHTPTCNQRRRSCLERLGPGSCHRRGRLRERRLARRAKVWTSTSPNQFGRWSRLPTARTRGRMQSRLDGLDLGTDSLRLDFQAYGRLIVRRLEIR